MADITATQARTVSTTDQVIYNEIDTITRAILTASLAGNLTVVVDDGTTMTQSTPAITVTSTGTTTFTATETIIIAGATITLGDGVNDGTGVEQAVADINNAAVTGLTATQSGTQIVLSYQPPQATWTLILAEGNGSALADLGFTASTVLATDPESVDYYNVWTSQATDRKKTYEYGQVVAHFQGIGYNIVPKKNIVTENTLKWELYW
jgi:hypothetical protein